MSKFLSYTLRMAAAAAAGMVVLAWGVSEKAAVGVAVLAWCVSKFFFGGESQHQGKDKFYVLHVDGLDSNQQEEAAAGCIIRDKTGEFVVAAAYNLSDCYPSCHIAIAEAMALKKGLELAKAHKIKVDLIKVDNEEVLGRVLDRDKKPPKVPLLIEIIQEIRSALKEQSIDPEKQLVLVNSSDNVVADELAQLGRTLDLEMKTIRKVNELSFKITNLIEEEKANWHLHKP